MTKTLFAASIAISLLAFSCGDGGGGSGGPGGGGGDSSGEGGSAATGGKGGTGGKAGTGGKSGTGGTGGTAATGGTGGTAATGGTGGTAATGGTGGTAACTPTNAILKATGVTAASCEFQLPTVDFDLEKTPCKLGDEYLPYHATNGWQYSSGNAAITVFGKTVVTYDGGVGDADAVDGGTTVAGWCDKVKAGTNLVLSCILNCPPN